MITKVIALFLVAIILVTPAAFLTGYYFGRNDTAPVQASRPQYLSIIAASLYAKYIGAASKEAGINSTIEAEGAVEAARQVVLSPSEFGIYATPDPSLITGIIGNMSGWYIAVASDQMVIAYSPLAPAANELATLNGEINASINAGGANLTAYLNDLYSIVLSPSSKLGITNPNTDPEGIDALLELQLAGIFENRSPSYYLDQFNALNASGSVAETTAGSSLIAYIQSGQIYYDIAMFKSAAEAYNLSYVCLPPQINLGSIVYSSYYRQASTVITVNGVPLQVVGGPIFFSMTIPNGYAHKELAAQLIVYMNSQPGRALMSKYGLSPLPVEMLYGDINDVPQPLSYLINSTSIENVHQ